MDQIQKYCMHYCIFFCKNSLRLLHGVTVMYRANGTSRHFCVIQIFGVPCLSEVAGCPLGSC